MPSRHLSAYPVTGIGDAHYSPIQIGFSKRRDSDTIGYCCVNKESRSYGPRVYEALYNEIGSEKPKDQKNKLTFMKEVL